ncbi:lactonase family protein [Aureliella helgolandensis]|uniref:6-phosphogluconolactonase n=1 Tax=Aureliella helgolandensis TaxID=2527968 RepID=A0A518G898_9BACT|nr:beta-propeller fold lactonase family protein [Aureliella helgolandensis]QDV24803.1 6-phosphogluconolactonase [Aureliella helgolandensis]
MMTRLHAAILSSNWRLAQVFGVVAVGVLTHSAWAQLPKESRLKHIEDVVREDLNAINRIAITDDGKFLYAASWGAGTVTTFARNDDGRIEHLGTTKLPVMDGAVDVVISPNQRFVSVIAFRSNSLLIFNRDSVTGKLKVDGHSRSQLQFSNAIDFSPDSRFLYVSNAQDETPLHGSMVCYEVSDTAALKNVQKLSGPEYYGMRDILVSKNGKKAYAACDQAGTVLEFDRSIETGELTLVNTLKDGEAGVNNIDGVLSLALSADGLDLFSVAGRFKGDNAVTWFHSGDDGKMHFVSDIAELGRFQGGNSIQIDPTGNTLYATATVSGSIAAIAVTKEEQKLVHLTTLVDGQNGLLTGAAGLTFSPDGKFLYVAVENADGIGVYEFIPSDSSEAAEPNAIPSE